MRRFLLLLSCCFILLCAGCFWQNDSEEKVSVTAPAGLLVLGYPKDRFWKHTRASWDYNFIPNLPRNTIIILAVNIVLIFLIYAVVDSKFI